MKHYFATITTSNDETHEALVEANSEEEAEKVIHEEFKDKTYVSHLEELKECRNTQN